MKKARSALLFTLALALLLTACGSKPESSSEAPYVDDYDPYTESWETTPYIEWAPRPETEPVGQAADWEMWGKTVDTSYYNNIAVTNDGSVWTWGYNAQYQAGTGYNTFRPTPVKVLDNGLTVEMGANHAAALRTDGSLWIWGGNSFGQSGTGREDAAILYPEKVMENIATIGAHTNTVIAIDKEQQLWSWGIETTGKYYGTIGVEIHEVKETYDTTPQKKLDNVLTAVGADARVTALRADGELWCWGSNLYGESGMEQPTTADGYSVTYVLEPTPILQNIIWADVGPMSAGYAVGRGNWLLIWGSFSLDKRGDIENYTDGDYFTPEAVMDEVKTAYDGRNHMMVLKTDGSLWTWGNNQYGQLGRGTFEMNSWPTVKIMDNVRVASSAHTDSSFAITEDDVLWGWGDNKYGQLGIGNNENQNAPVKIMEGVNSVYPTEGGYTVVLKQDGTLWTFGANYVGQLGDGTFEGRNMPVKILDDVRLPIPEPDWESRIWPENMGNTEAASEQDKADPQDEAPLQ